MNIKISKWTIFWKSLFGGKTAVFDYLLDVANNAVAQIPDATKTQLGSIYSALLSVRDAVARLDWAVPASWRPYYAGVMSCIGDVMDALSDGRVEKAELEKIAASFQSAYALWHTEG